MGLLEADVIEDLLHSSSISKGIERTMERLIHELEMDSMYIVRFDEDIRKAEVLFDWESGEIKRVIDFDGYINMIEEQYHFEEEDMYVAKATMVLPQAQRGIYHSQGYEAVIEYQMTNHGNVIGYIFIGWNKIKGITDVEIKEVHVLLKLMNEVLIRQFNKEVVGQSDFHLFKKANELTETIVYLIDDEFRIQFINSFGKENYPEIKQGDYCYKALQNQDSPCKSCPLKNVAKDGKYSECLYMPYMERNFYINACRIMMTDNRDGYMMTLQDQSALHPRDRRSLIGKKFVFAMQRLYKDIVAVEIRRDIFYNLFSTQAENSYSYSLDFVLKWLTKVHLDDKQKFLEYFDISFLQSAYENGEVKKEIDFRYRTHEGNYHIMNGQILFDNNSNKEVTVFILFQDVEQVRSRQIEDSRQMWESLMAARSSAELKGQVLANISHEIRNPMSGIISMASVARQVYQDENRLLECLDNIDNYTDHMMQVMDSLLETVKVDNDAIIIAKQPFRLKSFLNKIDIAVRERIEKKNMQFKIECICQYDQLLGDAIRLQQAFITLINNAIMYTPISGEIKLTAKQVEVDKKKVFIRFMLDDTGNSLSDMMKESVFGIDDDKERDVLEAHHFDLSLAAKIIQLMGGQIGINVDGSGTHLYFNLPFELQEEGEKTVSKKKLKNPAAADFSGKKILLAEDSEMSRDAIKAVLEVVGFDVETVENGRKAVIMFVSQPAFTYDAVLMDVHMPFMDGREATKCIRISGKEDGELIPVIGLMADSTDKDIEESKNAGMQTQLSKPVDVEKLYNVLHKVIKD